MKILCFALILSQNAIEENSPPTHIQELLKKRVLYQIKQQNPDRQFFFDESTCNVVGTYEYIDDSLQIKSNDNSLSLQLPYTDILNGKKLELSALSKNIENKENIVALASSQQNLFGSNEISTPSAQSGVKKWLPWIIVGAVGLTLGGYAIYSSTRDRGGSRESGSSAPTRRPR